MLKIFTKKEKKGFTRHRTGLARREAGFTIIEMIVAVAIFSVIMVVAVGALLSVISANRKAQSLQSIVNNLNLSLEEMVRTIRVGTTYHCGSSGDKTATQDCPDLGESYLAFEHSGGDPLSIQDQYVYRLTTDNQIERSISGINDSEFSPVTAPEAVIEQLTFYVTGTENNDNLQPRVIIIVSGYAQIDEKTRTDFNLQTAVSQRLPDF